MRYSSQSERAEKEFIERGRKLINGGICFLLSNAMRKNAKKRRFFSEFLEIPLPYKKFKSGAVKLRYIDDKKVS